MDATFELKDNDKAVVEKWLAPESLPKSNHYENMPIQIYWKFYHQKMKIFG